MYQILSTKVHPFADDYRIISENLLVKELFDWCTQKNEQDRPASCEQIEAVLDNPDNYFEKVKQFKKENLPLKQKGTSSYKNDEE